MAENGSQHSIKKIPVGKLRPGMYVHDLNCGWMDHPFVSSRFLIGDESTISTILGLGIQELYIDVSRGHDITETASPDAVSAQDSQDRLAGTGQAASPPTLVSLPEERARARRLHSEATDIARNMVQDVRLGRQIEMEKVEPLVAAMIDSIFRCPDALLPLTRLKEHDSYTFLHSVSVCALMIAFARELELERDVIKEIAIGALLHDVGKARIPDEILNKPARLTAEEQVRMQSHVMQSIVILRDTPGISTIALDVAGQHHERYDGTGYPKRLKGQEISLYGQMGAIVDVYDALTSERVYKKGMPPTEALGKLLEWSRHHFEPELVRRYIRSIGIYPTGSLVRLESGRLAIVLEQNPETPLQPAVWVMYHAKARHYLKPERLDLSRPSCQDRIVGHDDFASWTIDERKWLTAAP